MTYKKWDIVTVPFPFVDSNKSKPRPALIISSERFNTKSGHCITAMITTASKTNWYNDILIGDLTSAGLPIKSVIRFKLFSLDTRIILKKIGSLSQRDKELFIEEFQSIT